MSSEDNNTSKYVVFPAIYIATNLSSNSFSFSACSFCRFSISISLFFIDAICELDAEISEYEKEIGQLEGKIETH